MPHSDVPLWIGATDVCLTPLLSDIGEYYAGSPLKLFEYMACERAVVGADLPGIREHIEPHSSGLLYPAGDSESLMIQIKRLHQDKILRQRIASNGLSYILEYRTWEKVAIQIEELAANLDRYND